jgi:hypothetical protein
VLVADRASGEALELKVDEVACGVRDRDQLAGGRGEFEHWEGIARSRVVAGAGGCVHQFSCGGGDNMDYLVCPLIVSVTACRTWPGSVLVV